MYAVFSSYYKHAEVGLKIIDSDQELMDYCLDELAEYHGEEIEAYLKQRETGMPVNLLYRQQDQRQTYLQVIYQMYQGRTLDEVIAATIIKGNEHVEKENGWGVRYIVGGNNLVPFGN